MIRDFENTPHPSIEDHPHIRMLWEGQDKRVKDRTYHREKEKNAQDRMDSIKAAKWKEILPFWCNSCSKDFLAEGIKEVEQDWSNPSQYISFYRAKCDRGHWCMRLITDRRRDTYFYRSKAVARDRALHHVDTIQSWETGFNLLYGRKNAS